MIALAALKAGACAILVAEGKGEIAALVEKADIERSGDAESWAMGSRVVTADRLALSVDAAGYVALTGDADALEALRSAFDRAMRTPETALSDLAIVLRLPGPNAGWHHVYREPPARARDERPSPDRIRAGAIDFLRAKRSIRAAGLLERASIEAAVVGATAGIPLVRFVVRLAPEDLVLAEADDDLADEVRRAVLAAGTRAAERVASVDLAVRLPD